MTAVAYLVVGLEWVAVDGIADVEPGPAVPLVIAGVVFAGLAVLLARHPGTFVYLAGALLCVVVLVMYVVVAPTREPSYEPLGIAIKAVEAVLLGALGYLLVGPDRRARQSRHVPDPPYA
jgi:hypothetical protein